MDTRCSNDAHCVGAHCRDDTRRTVDEIDHAIERYTKVCEGLRMSKLEAHAIMADQAVAVLKWVKGEPSKFGDTLTTIDAVIAAALAHTN